jgi:5-oxoprolinase (ATP-hydrolysing)
MAEPRWQFWIDVGGTFTDVFARRPDGMLLRHKVLSSGVTKGSGVVESTDAEIIDPMRQDDPPGFWEGYRLQILDSAGNTVAKSQIVEFEPRTGTLRLASPIEIDRPGQTNYEPNSYELSCGEEAPVLAIRYLLGLRLHEVIPPVDVRLGTTRGTNALLTRSGAKTALVTTKGFGDILRIGYQNRPKLFELAIHRPSALFVESIEIDERITPAGDVLVAPDRNSVRRKLEKLKHRGVESLAVCLLHASEHPAHELLVGEIAREVGFDEMSLSHQVAPLAKIVSRGDTTVVDAYLNPVLRAYVASLRRVLVGSDVRILTSAGGLVAADHFIGKDSILSGPAGGVVGFSRVAQAAGFTAAIGFDMGGTSTDVSRFDGRFELEHETEKAGVRIVAPMMAIETVAAGGGSICWFDGVKLAVGPDSAGADPGPACYGRSGPLAVTDLNFFLGKILPDRFPFPLDHAAVERRLSESCEEIAVGTGTRYTPIELADGFLRIANANMVRAIRSISVAKGCDPRDYVMVAFGGAAAQHACAVARELGIARILNHQDAGILSAYGIGLADVLRHRAAGVYRTCTVETLADVELIIAKLDVEARQEVVAEGVPSDRIETTHLLDLRYQGQDAMLTIPRPEHGGYRQAYEAEHRRLYGYVHADRPLEIVAARVEAIGRCETKLPPSNSVETTPREPSATTELFFDATAHRAGVFDRESLQPGDLVTGPAVIHEPRSTTIVDPHWHAEVLSGGELLLTDSGQQQSAQIATDADPVMLEIFNNLFAAIAEQMGITLRNTALSVNVKERLDFSCAIFTAAGELVVNAPHIPVHLGAMGETVKYVLADNPDLRPGDVFVTNDPYRGGSHLPDVTVVTPVHDDTTGDLLFLTASRAHHAEIGGTRPGSMPPESTCLAEEGVLIRNFKLVDAGQSRIDQLGKLLASAEFPSRRIEDNLADVTAQVAANQHGARDLAALVERYSLPVTLAYMRHIQDAAERKMRTALARLPDGRHTWVDHLDDGSPIAVAITVEGDAATFDFAGTGPVLSGNLNANRAIVTAAVMYCLRCLIDEEIPLNQGVLAPVQIELPECLLNPPAKDDPRKCAAVVGGNVETSQRVVDAILGALGVAAASQGTMNNLLIGDDSFGYYETISGGSGATPDLPGADAVQTHMTNTRLTDPEVIERRYPLRVRRFAIRRGSGGKGKQCGGDGVIRELEFLSNLQVSILSQRRGPYPPYGQRGGSPGEIGRNQLRRANGTIEDLSGIAQFVAHAGDVLRLETPGGGGFGQPEQYILSR